MTTSSLSKEKQISELGKKSREECSRALMEKNINIENISAAEPSPFSPVHLEHDYCKYKSDKL